MKGIHALKLLFLIVVASLIAWQVDWIINFFASIRPVIVVIATVVLVIIAIIIFRKEDLEANW